MPRVGARSSPRAAGSATRRGAGFYKKVGKDITTLDWKTLEYGPQQKVEDPALAALMKQPLAQRLQAATRAAGQVRRVRAQLSAAHVALRAEDDAGDRVRHRRRRPRDRVGLRVGSRSLPADGRARRTTSCARASRGSGSTCRRCSREAKDGAFYHADAGGWTSSRLRRRVRARAAGAGPDLARSACARAQGRRARELEATRTSSTSATACCCSSCAAR